VIRARADTLPLGIAREENQMAHMHGSASAEIDAPIDRCYEIAADIEGAPVWQGGFDRAVAIERGEDGRATLVETETDAKVRTVKTQLRMSYDPPSVVRWEQAKGDLKSLVGSWTLDDLGDGRTRATYTLDLDPGRVLGLLIRGPVEPMLRRMLVNARPGELKARVEGS
jgi:uncharacterized protein YcbX